ncbi:MAG: cob(I)yrinic acid a,c-diamide adenosyltransferase, partial [Longimicrobiales bacterium]
LLRSVQADLFALGAHLATPAHERKPVPWLPPLPTARIDELESWIDEAEAKLPALRSFILPGGAPGGAALHVSRTVCRRAERRVIGLSAAEDVDPSIVIYLNRLSDVLFVAARLANRLAGMEEQRWEPRSGDDR